MLSLPKSIRIFFTYIPVNPHWWLENPGTLMAFTRKETWFFHDRYQSPSSAMWKERPFFRFSTLGSFWSSKRTFVFFWTFSFLEKTCSFWTDTNVHMEKTGHCADLLWTRYLWPLHRQKKVIHDHPPIGPVLARINEAYEYTFVSHVGSRRKHDFFPTKIYPFEKFLSFLSNFGIDVFYREHDYPNDLLVDSQSPFALAKGLLLGSPKKKSFVLRHFFGRWSLAMDRYFFPISNTYQTKPVQLGGLPKWWWWFFGEFFGHQGLLQDLQLYNLQMTSITRSTAITAADRGVGWGKKPRMWMLGGRVGG